MAVGRQARRSLSADHSLPVGRQRGPVRPGGLPEVEGGEDVALHAQEVLLVVRAVRDVDPVGAPAWWKQASSRRPSLGSRLDRRPSFEPLRGRRRQQLRQRQGRRSRERLSTALERVGGELSPWSLRRNQGGGHGKARGAGFDHMRHSGAKISSYLDAMNIAVMPTSCSLLLMIFSFSR